MAAGGQMEGDQMIDQLQDGMEGMDDMYDQEDDGDYGQEQH